MLSDKILTQLYIGYFGCAPEPEGFDFWKALLESNFPLLRVAEGFAPQSEALALYPELGEQQPSNLTRFLNDVYQNLFGRETDAAGLDFWTSVLQNGWSIGRVILDIIQGAQGDDVTALQNKTDVAQVFTGLARQEPDFVLTPEAIEMVTLALKLVGLDPFTAGPDGKPAIDIEAFFREDVPETGGGGGGGAGDPIPPAAPLFPVELSAIQTSTDLRGFMINGVTSEDASGWAVSSAGDVNGDGFDDLIVGAPYVKPDGQNSTGASYVVFGKADGTVVELATVQASDPASGGFVINGFSDFDNAGISVSSAGDVNGDGLDDLIIGAPIIESPHSGASYVVFGKTDGTAIELSGFQGFALIGSDRSKSGYAVSSAGDVNGDGLNDLIVGAPIAGRVGKSYVVFGKSDGTAINLNFLGPSDGFSVSGAGRGSNFGYSVSSAGDVNGDGLDDLIVGAPNHNFSGSTYVFFGKTDGTSVSVHNNDGFAIIGAATGDRSGSSVSSAGDVNGDGLDDLI